MNVGLPNCTVDIYPYEGGSFTFSGPNGTLLACQTEKNIWDPSSGTFTLTLAPNGPFGPNANPQWFDIIRPMSLTVITMQRFGRARIVMIGLALSIREQEVWSPGTNVRRGLIVQGQDFGHMFAQTNFYAQLLFNFSKGSVLTPGGALGNVLGLGTQNISLDQAAQAWYSKVMAGQSGLLSNTNFAYQGSRVTFDNLMSTLFKNYPNLDLEIPTAQNYALLTGSWYDTFAGLFPFPWFELFCTTAEVDDYGQAASSVQIQSTQPGVLAANPVFIARPLPIPTINNNSGSFALDMSLWNALPTFTLDSQPFVRNLQFTDSGVKNLYAVVPTYLGTLFGGQNGDVAPLLYQTGVWVDSASIERYGYRPFVFNPGWFADPNGDMARSTASSSAGIQGFVNVVGEIALKSASFYEPTPLMAEGSISTNLRPDITPGSILQFPPTKDVELWNFYITGVSHEFVYGGRSVTSLTLTRGLPDDVYSDQDLMLAILSGNAMRQDGNYIEGLPSGSGSPLQNINFNNGTDITAQIAAVYNTPGQM